MKVLVCGGRNFSNVPLLWRTLDDVYAEYGHHGMTIIDGASDDVTGPYVGADYWAHQWAISCDLGTERYHAEWKKRGGYAGPHRNQRMLDEGKPELVIAFPGGSGTADMVRRARKAGVSVHEIAAADPPI